MKRYRLKTEQEFLNEFGVNWRSEVRCHWNSAGEMDYLFGKILSEEQNKYFEKYLGLSIDGWTINESMITQLGSCVIGSKREKRKSICLNQEN
jgi:hypothetical protein